MPNYDLFGNKILTKEELTAMEKAEAEEKKKKLEEEKRLKAEAKAKEKELADRRKKLKADLQKIFNSIKSNPVDSETTESEEEVEEDEN